MRQADAQRTAAARTERLFIGESNGVEAWCVIMWRSHRTLNSMAAPDCRRGVYGVSRAPKRYELTRGGVVVARPDSYEAAMKALEGA